MKLDVDGQLYHNISLKYVTKFDVLNRMCSDPWENRKCCDYLIKKETKEKIYTDNYLHAKIEPKLQKMIKVQVLIIILRIK